MANIASVIITPAPNLTGFCVRGMEFATVECAIAEQDGRETLAIAVLTRRNVRLRMGKGNFVLGMEIALVGDVSVVLIRRERIDFLGSIAKNVQLVHPKSIK